MTTKEGQPEGTPLMVGKHSKEFSEWLDRYFIASQDRLTQQSHYDCWQAAIRVARPQLSADNQSLREQLSEKERQLEKVIGQRNRWDEACQSEKSEHTLTKSALSATVEDSARLEAALRGAELDAARLDWLENNHTLHREVEILYVVDGYEVTLMHEDGLTELSPRFRGDDLRAAIDEAIAKGK